MAKTKTTVKAYLTQVERKNECVRKLNSIRQTAIQNAEEYEKCVMEYFGLLMDDISKNRPLSELEIEFIKGNTALLKKYPKAKRVLLREKLEKMGIIKPKAKEKVEYTTMTYDELFPSTDISATIEKSVKKLKDAYVYLKPGIKLCDKLIDYIHTLRFTVKTTVSAPAEKKAAPKSKEVAMGMN